MTASDLKVMSFGDHLEELRGRIVRALLAVAIGFFVALIFQERILAFITRPHREAMAAVGLGQEVRKAEQHLASAVDHAESIDSRAVAPDIAAARSFSVLERTIREELPTIHEREPSVAAAVEAILGHLEEREEANRRVFVVPQISAEIESTRRAIEESRAATHWAASGPDWGVLEERLAAIEATIDSWSAAAEPSATASRPAEVNPNGSDAGRSEEGETARADAADRWEELLAEIRRARERIAIAGSPTAEFRKLHFFSYPESFFSHLKVCFLAAVLFGLPWLAFELWQFVSAGLYPRERRAVYPFLPLSLAFMLCGAAFAYFVLIPVGLAYLGGYGGEDFLEASFRLKDYLSLVITMLLGMALVFQLPLLMVFAVRAQFVEPQAFRTYRKFAILGALLIGSLLTPPDIVTQLLMAGPLVFLYESGILVSTVMQKRWDSSDETTEKVTSP